MLPRRLTIRGLTRFTNEITLDLDQLPDGLVAVTGGNGSGKTTIMESMGPGALFLELPSRPGNLQDKANRRDAFLELIQDFDGRTWRHLVEVDPGTGASGARTEAYLWELAPGAELPPVDSPTPEGTWIPVDGYPTPGRLGDYRAALDGLGFPSRDVFLAGPFSVHTGAGNFLELTTAQRRDLFVTLLGLGDLQRLSDRAAAARKPLDAALVELEDLAAALERDRAQAAALAADADRLQAEVTAAAAEVQRLDADATAAGDQVATARAELASLEDARRVVLERKAELERRKVDLDHRAADIQRQIDADEALVDQDAAIRAAAARHRELSERRAALIGERSGYVAAHQAAARELTAQRQEVSRLADRRKGLEADLAALDGLEDRAAALEARAAGLPELRAEHAELTRQASELRAESGRADAAHQAAQRDAASPEAARARLERLERDAGLLGGVPCQGRRIDTTEYREPSDPRMGPVPYPAVVDCGACRFLVEARKAAQDAPAARAALEAAEAQAEGLARSWAAAGELRARAADVEARRDQAGARLRDLERTASDAAQLRERLARLDGLARELQAVAARSVELSASLPELERTAAEAAAAVERVDGEGRTLRAELDQLQAAPDRARLLDVAAGRLPDRYKGRELALDSLAEITSSLIDLREPAEPVAARQRLQELASAQAAARARVEASRAALDGLRERLGHARGRLAELGDLEARGASLEASRATLARRRAGFREVERACGKTGIQVLEIDAAGPTVARLCNDLLAATFGGRFAVRLDTQTEASGKRKARETFDLVVLDGNRKARAEDSAGEGRRAEARERLAADVSELSKGEKVLVDEALKLAIAMFHAQRTGSRVLTLWRDEADGGLDPENRRRYPAMLRRALEIGGFRRLYFVSHDPDVQAQADAVIRVSAAGTIGIEVQ